MCGNTWRECFACSFVFSVFFFFLLPLYLPAMPIPEACDMPGPDSHPNSTLARISIWHECTIRPLVPLQKALTEINSHSRGWLYKRSPQTSLQFQCFQTARPQCMNLSFPPDRDVSDDRTIDIFFICVWCMKRQIIASYSVSLDEREWPCFGDENKEVRADVEKCACACLCRLSGFALIEREAQSIAVCQWLARTEWAEHTWVCVDDGYTQHSFCLCKTRWCSV